jgi:hypothetical protein
LKEIVAKGLIYLGLSVRWAVAHKRSKLARKILEVAHKLFQAENKQFMV